MRLLFAAPALLVCAASFSGAGDEGMERAHALERARDWPALAGLLEERGRRSELSADERRLLGTALEQLGRLDEAAQQLDAAAVGFERAGREPEQKAALAAVRRLDPLSARRDPFLRKVAATLITAAEDLLDGGDAERAVSLAEKLPRVARGKDAARAEALLKQARAAFEKVQLTDGAEEPPAGGELPLFEMDSEHYRFACHLEPDVVRRLARLMEDLHAFYVQVYFDADSRKARSSKATIRVLPNKERMLASWQGGGSPDGWWSPGTGEVYAYDSRSTPAGTLDAMLETLFHEASHQFMTLLSGGSPVPAWLNEGTATFFEGAVAMADGRVLWPRAALGRLGALRWQIAGGKAPRVREVIAYESPGSYAPEYYSWGWGLVYFLQEYEDPATLQHVYRPLYSRYRSEMIKRGSGSLELFEKTMLGKASPLGHADLAAFERDFERWILDEVAPLHGRDATARRMRIERAERLLARAGEVGRKKGGSEAEDLLARALIHTEWVRAEIDKDKPDGALLLQQADILERLGRASAAAALVEQTLELSDSGAFALSEERAAELETRLRKLDRRNAALRTARQRTNDLTRTALALVADYKASGFVLRAYTLAADLAAVLGEPLAPAAAELREAAREKGLLWGTIRALASPAKDWLALLSAPPDAFEVRPGSVALACVRAAALVDGRFSVSDEYVLRATIQPGGPREVGSSFGFVVGGAPGREAVIVGIDERGHAGLWSVNAAAKDAATLRRVRTIGLVPPLAAGERVDLDVHVHRDGRLVIRAGDRAPVEADSGLRGSAPRHVGLYAKYVQVRFEDPRVEILP